MTLLYCEEIYLERIQSLCDFGSFFKERESEKGDLAQIGGVRSLWPPRFHLLVQLWPNTGENQVPVRPNVLRKSTCLETGANDEGHHVDVDP